MIRIHTNLTCCWSWTFGTILQRAIEAQTCLNIQVNIGLPITCFASVFRCTGRTVCWSNAGLASHFLFIFIVPRRTAWITFLAMIIHVNVSCTRTFFESKVKFSEVQIICWRPCLPFPRDIVIIVRFKWETQMCSIEPGYPIHAIISKTDTFIRKQHPCFRHPIFCFLNGKSRHSPFQSIFFVVVLLAYSAIVCYQSQIIIQFVYHSFHHIFTGGNALTCDLNKELIRRIFCWDMRISIIHVDSSYHHSF